VYIYEEDM
jgi:hypothetical protein